MTLKRAALIVGIAAGGVAALGGFRALASDMIDKRVKAAVDPVDAKVAHVEKHADEQERAHEKEYERLLAGQQRVENALLQLTEKVGELQGAVRRSR